METKKRISNSSIIIFTTLCCVLGLVCATMVRYVKNHNEKMVYSTEEQIKYIAKRCYYEDNCKAIMTLKDLYDKGYISEVVNPVTREMVDINKKIYINGSDVVFNLNE